jgi:hypothetical protein
LRLTFSPSDVALSYGVRIWDGHRVLCINPEPFAGESKMGSQANRKHNTDSASNRLLPPGRGPSRPIKANDEVLRISRQSQDAGTLLQAADDNEAQDWWAEIKLLARVRIGELVRDPEKAKAELKRNWRHCCRQPPIGLPTLPLCVSLDRQ